MGIFHSKIFVAMCTHSMEFDSFYRAGIYGRPCIVNMSSCINSLLHTSMCDEFECRKYVFEHFKLSPKLS